MPMPGLVGVYSALLCVAASAFAEPTLDPYSVHSPNGKVVVAVRPSDMDGAGPAHYAVTDGGKPLWQMDLAFTLWKAEVADDGTIGGFAYNNGYNGRGKGGGDEKSAILCVIIDRRGVVRTEDAHERKHPQILSTPPPAFEPLGLGVTLDAGQDRFMVRAAGSFGEEQVRWWVYRLSTGESLGEIIPDQPKKPADGLGFHREIAADLIPGTPLLLAHWYIYNSGARFAVLDPKGKEVWNLEQTDEYTGLGKDFSWWNLAENGIHQTAVRDKSFDIVSYALKARVSYEISPDLNAPSGFAVKETKRSAETPAPKSTAQDDLATITLESAGTIELKAPAPTSPIDNVHDFNIDGKGRLGFVRWVEGGQPRFVLVNPDGSVQLDLALDLPSDPKAELPVAAPVEPDRWIIVRSSYDDAAPTAAWWLDTGTKSLTPFKEFRAGKVKALRGLGGGGFMAEGSSRDPELVVVFTSKGERRAAVGQAEIGMMESAAVRTDGSIAVLVGVANTIECFDASGKHTRSDALATVLGGRPNYPSTIRADRDGGLILEDFDGVPPIYRVGADNKVTTKFTPKFSDGRAFRTFGGVQCAPDGTLWTSDSHSLVRFDERGVVDRVLGPSPTADDLSHVNALAVGPTGLIYAVDARTSAVHVFDAAGVRVRVCQPKPGDFPSDRAADEIAVAKDHSVWIHAQMGSLAGPAKYFGFAENCDRLDPKRCSLDRIKETWHFQPQASARWVLGYEKLWLVSDKDEVVQTIEHRPSGAWLGHVDTGAVAPNGSLAVIAGPREMGMRGPAELNIYSATGEPVKTIPLPDKWIGMRLAFNGRWAITADEAELHLYNVETGRSARFTIPAGAGAEHYWCPFTTADGNEVWVQDAGGRSLQRFRLPNG